MDQSQRDDRLLNAQNTNGDSNHYLRSSQATEPIHVITHVSTAAADIAVAARGVCTSDSSFSDVTSNSSGSFQGWLGGARDLDALVDCLATAAGAQGKDDDLRTRLTCRFVLSRFRAGALGPMTLDDLPTITDSSSQAISVVVQDESDLRSAKPTKIYPGKPKGLLYNPVDIF